MWGGLAQPERAERDGGVPTDTGGLFVMFVLVALVVLLVYHGGKGGGEVLI